MSEVGTRLITTKNKSNDRTVASTRITRTWTKTIIMTQDKKYRTINSVRT